MARGALSGIYNGRLYQKQDVRNSDTPYNYFLFDISSGCRFFANRVTYKCPEVGESLYDIMSDESIDELITHLTSFSEAPIFVLTKLGVAIVLPHLVPCSSFGILVLPHFDGSYLYRIFKHKKWDAVYSKEVDALPSLYSSNSKRYTADAELLYDRIHAAFDRVVGNPALLLRDNITAHLEERVYALS